MNTNENDAMKRPNKKFGLFLIVAAILVIAVLAGLIPRLLERAALTETTRKLAVPAVAVVSPEPGSATAVLMLPAQIEPWIETPIYARVSGYLKSWKVDIGARVKEGEVLAVIEKKDLDAQVAQAEANLKAAEAGVDISRASLWPVVNADGGYDVLDNRYPTRDSNTFAGLKMSVPLFNGEDKYRKRQSRDLKDAAKASLEYGKVQLSYATITAPFSGTITSRTADAGQLITANATQLFQLSQTGKLRVYVNVPQDEAFGVKPGDTAELLISGLSGRSFKATVVATADRISDASRTLLTQLEVDNSSGEIVAGSFGQVKLSATRSKAELILPENTVLFGADGPHVAVVLPDGKVVAQSVKLGRNFGMAFEVLAGVTAHDRVVSNPSEWLMGMEVNAVAVDKRKQDQP